MRVRGLLVHLFKGGWQLYRVRGGAPLPKDLQASPMPQSHRDAEGGFAIFVQEGELIPARVRVPKSRKPKGKRRCKV
jgi:hypothetical protein